jgi:hypothetical protein
MVTRYSFYKNSILPHFLWTKEGQSKQKKVTYYKYAADAPGQANTNPPAAAAAAAAAAKPAAPAEAAAAPSEPARSAALTPLTQEELSSLLAVLAARHPGNLADPNGPLSGFNSFLSTTLGVTQQINYDHAKRVYNPGIRVEPKQIKPILDYLNYDRKEYLKHPKAAKEAFYGALLLATSSDSSYNQLRSQLMASFRKIIIDYNVYVIDSILANYEQFIDKNQAIFGALDDEEKNIYNRHKEFLKESKDVLLKLKEINKFGELSKELSNIELAEVLKEIYVGAYISEFAKTARDNESIKKIKTYFRNLYEPILDPSDKEGKRKLEPLRDRLRFEGHTGPTHYAPIIKELVNQAVLFDQSRRDVHIALQQEAKAAGLEVYSPNYWRNVMVGAGAGTAIGFGLAYVLNRLFRSFKQKSKEHAEDEDEEQEEGSSLLNWLLPTTGLLLGGYLGHTGSKYT